MDNIVDIVLRLPAVFLAMTFHEYAHAYVAYKQGDDTPQKMGRLTLDPLVHVDWIGLAMFTLFGFGWAKPVRVNTSNFRNKRWGDIFVSLAGPAANLFIALMGTLMGMIVVVFFKSIDPYKLDIINTIIHNIIYLNIIFMLLNLIPIPPLDGYNIVKNLFFRKYLNAFLKLEKYSVLILLVFIMFGVFDLIISRPAIYIYGFLMKTAASIISLFL